MEDGWFVTATLALFDVSAPCDLSCFYFVKVEYVMHMSAGCLYLLHPLSGAAVCILLKGNLADKMLAKWASGSGWSSGSSSLESTILSRVNLIIKCISALKRGLWTHWCNLCIVSTEPQLYSRWGEQPKCHVWWRTPASQVSSLIPTIHWLFH